MKEKNRVRQAILLNYFNSLSLSTTNCCNTVDFIYCLEYEFNIFNDPREIKYCCSLSLKKKV